MQQDIRAYCAKLLGAHQAWIVRIKQNDVVNDVLQLPDDCLAAAPLHGKPLQCADIKSLGLDARLLGTPLLVDVTMTSIIGCAANRLGAHIAYTALGEDLWVIGVSGDAQRLLPDISFRLDGIADTSELSTQTVRDLLSESTRRWRMTSDAAQVVASYLRCHPCVDEVRYPGLKNDPSFSVAARTLSYGFGPFVDYRLRSSEDWRRVVCGMDDVREQVLHLESTFACDAERPY